MSSEEQSDHTDIELIQHINLDITRSATIHTHTDLARDYSHTDPAPDWTSPGQEVFTH